MKKIITVLIIVLSLIITKLLLSYSINEILISNYKKGTYKENLIKILYTLNVNEPYIVYYNDGNILYRKKEYNFAIEKYDEALKNNPPEKRVCDIRINKSLAMVYRIDSKDTDVVYNELEEAKNNLYNDGCANKLDDKGKSKTAEKLEEEIKKLQEQVKNSSKDDPNNGGNDDDDDDNETPPPDLEEELKNQEKESKENREDDMNSVENLQNFSVNNNKRRW